MRRRASRALCATRLPALLRSSGSLEGRPSWTSLSPHPGYTGARMTPLRAKMIADMQLHRLAPGTQARALRAVASLAIHDGRSPEHLTSDEIRTQGDRILNF